MLIFLLIGAKQSFGQSAKVKVEIKLTKVKAYKDAARGPSNNEIRFDVWLEPEDSYGSTEIQAEINDVKKKDLPQEVVASGSTATYMDYGKSVQIWLEGWEEDCDDDNEYNDNFLCKDDRRCMKGFDLVYMDKEPGTWYPKNNLLCPNKYEISIEYRWSFSVLPGLIPQNENVDLCLNEDILHFLAKNDFPHSKFVDRFEWNISKKVLLAKDSTEAQCLAAHPAKDDNYYECVYDSDPYYEEDYHDVDKKTTTENKLGYATNLPALWIKYREIYKNGEASPWSKQVEKKHQFYDIVVPSSVNATTDGDEVITNLYCQPSALTLTAAPPADRSWANYNFKWYRKVGGGVDKGELIVGKTQDTITDDGFSAYAGQKLRYTVEVYRNGCTKPLSSRESNQLFFFEDVPTLSTHIDTTNDIKKASCSTTRDGELIIRASSTNPALRYYYNIGRLDAAGNVQSTEIRSSGREAANIDFPFKDLLPGDYKVQVLHGGYDGLKTATYTQQSDFSNAGYCYNEHTINIPYRDPFTLGTSSCHPRRLLRRIRRQDHGFVSTSARRAHANIKKKQQSSK